MLCPKCHTNNSDDEKYCRNCGFQLNASRICPECGAHNKHDTKFCKECGASLSPVNSFRRDVIENKNESFFNKYRSIIIAAIILVLAIGAVTGIALYNNASSNTGRSDDGFSFFPLDNDTNQNIQVDDVNDTNESDNDTNKTVNGTDKNKTSDKNKDNFTDKNKNATKKKSSDSNNASNKANKSVESVENHSKVLDSNDNKTKNTSSDSQSDKSSKISSSDSQSDKSSKISSSDSQSDKSSKASSSDSKSDKSSKASSSDSKTDKSSNIFPFANSEESKNTSSDTQSDESLADDSQNSSNESTEVENDQGNVSDDENQSDEDSNEIDMADVPELAKEVKSKGYSFSTIEFDGKELSQSQCIAIFAKYISTSKSGSIEIPQVGSASSPSGEDLSQSVSKHDYMAVASDVNSYISSNGRIPDNVVISGEEESDISPSKILELLTKAIAEDFPESVDI